MDISFFNPFHNGDLFVSKEFIRQISDEHKIFSYYHNNHEKVLKDLEIEYKKIDFNIPRKKLIPESIEKKSEILYNTWFGAYKLFFDNRGINFYSMAKVFSHIFNKINLEIGSALKIQDLYNYVPYIDTKFFDNNNTDIWLSSRLERKKILISNGPVHSKQSFNDNFSEIIKILSITYQNIDFICTHKIEGLESDNIFYTSDIIKDSNGCDLNEISYLSEKCSLIIGKNSGPYIFTITRNNLYQTSKTFIQFNHLETDSLFYRMDFPAKYIWSNVYEKNNLIKIIEMNL
jgi:hypothetical protein